MKSTVFHYDIEDQAEEKLYGISVPHRRVLYKLKESSKLIYPNSSSSFSGTMMQSELALVKKFSELVKKREIPKALAEELLDMIEAYGDDRSSKARDESEIFNMGKGVYIASGKGFVKEISYVKREDHRRETVIEWSEEITHAQLFESAKRAKKFIENNKLEAFIWNPWKEQHEKKGMWRIKRRSSFTSYFNGHPTVHEAMEWYPEKVVHEPETDFKHLSNIGNEPETLYSNLQEATAAANEKNLVVLLELQKKIQDLTRESEFRRAEDRGSKYGI